MWLLTTLVAALMATLLWFLLHKKHKLGLLSLMLWGATIMIAVDHVLGYKGGPFFESTTGGMIQNASVLGIVMLVPVIGIWLIALITSRLQTRRKNSMNNF